VTFKYETRDQAVFENLSFEIKPGQKVGFVGPSGCGKSTVYQLLQRFYDQNSGEVLIDG
jgi:ABC-type multidrug transport system fused ATPase/permease subunit